MPHVDPPVPANQSTGAAVEALWELTHTLRQHCPWDQVQTAATIVPHTVEEAYEVAAAARAAQDEPSAAALTEFVDELGDLLFQVTFLAMWCAEHDPAFDLTAVANAIRTKLVRRHPHVFGDVVAHDADTVLANWDDIKRDVEGRGADGGIFAGVSHSLAPIQLATKLQSRAAKVGFDFASARVALEKVDEELAEVREALTAAEAAGAVSASADDGPPDAALEAELGDLAFALANVARLSRVDLDLALQGASLRFRNRVSGAEQLATDAGHDFAALDLDAQEALYQRAKSRPENL